MVKCTSCKVFLHNRSCGWHCLNWVQRLGGSVHIDLAIGVTCGTLARYVPRLTTFVAYFANCIKGPTVGSGAVARNMALFISVMPRIFSVMKFTYKLSTCIAFHSLGLTVASVVIWSTTFVTGGWTKSPSEASTEATSKASARHKSPATNTHGGARLKSSIWACTLRTCQPKNCEGKQEILTAR